MSLDWSRLFPPGEYGFHMGLRVGGARAFFSATGNSVELLAERGRWLNEEPEKYEAALPEGLALVEEAAELAVGWGTQVKAEVGALGRVWEPDFVLLREGEDGAFRVVAGAVCFPTSWALRDKLGHSLAETHGPVPGLNAAIGARIDMALARLAPDAAWERENWGLARDAERNHHPARPRPRLDETITPQEVWLRVERQCLVKLPRTGGVLFGIRLVLLPFAQVLAEPAAADGLRRALASMPGEVAAYKGLAQARAALLGWLEG
jgi:hypothetical protein